MFQEFEDVVLVVDLPDYGLQVGDVGAIVDIDKTGRQVTLEIFSMTGRTIAVVPVAVEAVRSVGNNEIAHMRVLS